MIYEGDPEKVLPVTTNPADGQLSTQPDNCSPRTGVLRMVGVCPIPLLSQQMDGRSSLGDMVFVLSQRTCSLETREALNCIQEPGLQGLEDSGL